jgi:hypothetical protein
VLMYLSESDDSTQREQYTLGITSSQDPPFPHLLPWLTLNFHIVLWGMFAITDINRNYDYDRLLFES